MKKLILLTGQNCPLCEKAKEVLKSLHLREYTILEKDIYSSREWLDKYWDKIPVLLSESRDLVWPFEDSEVQKFISI